MAIYTPESFDVQTLRTSSETLTAGITATPIASPVVRTSAVIPVNSGILSVMELGPPGGGSTWPGIYEPIYRVPSDVNEPVVPPVVNRFPALTLAP